MKPNFPDIDSEKPREEHIKNIREFEEWLTKSGADLSKIEIRYLSSTNRTLHAKVPIKKEEVICNIPNSCIIDE
jgi:hypothetical protein